MCVVVLLAGLPAGAQNGGDGVVNRGDHDRRISVTGGVVVAADEAVDGPVVSADVDARIAGRVNGAVYVGRGDLAITGRVTGDALDLDGDATVVGRVDGEVTVVNGKATVLPGANVRGNVTSRTSPTAAPGTVHVSVDKLRPGLFHRGARFRRPADDLRWSCVQLRLDSGYLHRVGTIKETAVRRVFAAPDE